MTALCRIRLESYDKFIRREAAIEVGKFLAS